ncbi:MAG: hypothetical protein DMG06_28190 [Acidobacteria bacterium]|nr:MAG: hypothetical protein DMG06_28190 [Acidobacteriota bacterium]
MLHRNDAQAHCMRNTSALDTLFPGVRRGVLTATLTRPEKWWYLSELANFLHIRPSSPQRELAALVQSGILEQRRDGRRTYFKAETRSPIFRDLHAAANETSLIMTMPMSQTEAQESVTKAKEFVDMVEQWIAKSHPALRP